MVTGMEKRKETPTSEALGKNSQVARFRKIVKQTNFSLVLGIVLLVLLFFASISYAVVSNEQLESTICLL